MDYHVNCNPKSCDVYNLYNYTLPPLSGVFFTARISIVAGVLFSFLCHLFVIMGSLY